MLIILMLYRLQLNTNWFITTTFVLITPACTECIHDAWIELHPPTASPSIRHPNRPYPFFLYRSQRYPIVSYPRPPPDTSRGVHQHHLQRNRPTMDVRSTTLIFVPSPRIPVQQVLQPARSRHRHRDETSIVEPVGCANSGPST